MFTDCYKLSITKAARFVVCMLVLCYAQLLNASADNIRFERIGVEDGLSQQTVMEIFQDSKGFMWFGTQEGLNKYDGVDFESYSPKLNQPDSISSPWISSINEDAKGNLWVGTKNGLSVLNRETNKFERYLNDDSSASINDKHVRIVLRDRNDTMWVATKKGLNKYVESEKRFKHFTFQNIDSSYIDVYNMVEDVTGALWIGSDVHGLLRFDPVTEKLTVIKSNLNPQMTQKVGIRAMYIDDNQVLWIGTNGDGLYKLDLMQPKPENIEDTIVRVEGFNGIPTEHIAQDQQNTLWVGTTQGLYYQKQGGTKFLKMSKDAKSGANLSNQAIWCLLPDRSGVFWVGTFSGLHKWNTRTTQFDHLYADEQSENSLSSNNTTVINKSGNLLYVGTDLGVDVVNLDTDEVTTLPVNKDKPAGLSGPKAMSMAVVSEEEIWFGHRDSGATKYNPKTNTYKHYKPDLENPNSIGATGIPAILLTSDGNLWFGTFGGGLSRYNKDTDDFTSFKHDDTDISTLSSNRVMTLYESKNGNLWVGTFDAGLNVFVPSTGAAFRMQKKQDDPNSIGDDWIQTIHEDIDGNIWIGTQGGGLNILTTENLNRGRFVFDKLHEGNGMPSNVIYGILEDEKGFIWGSTNRGLVKINRITKDIVTYTVDQGIQDNEFNSGPYFKDGEYMYFGGTNGVTRFRPKDIKPNEIPPQIELTNFQRLNKVHSIAEVKNKNGIIETVYTDYLIGFEFAALDFASPSNNKYKYTLEGFDVDWIEVRDVRRAIYTNLPSGRYTFKVIASNSDGVWNNEGKSITLLVHPAPWFSWWAYAIYTFVVLVILWFTVAHFKRKAQSNLQYQINLEQEVNERTAELSEANEQLLHASITDQLTGLRNRRYLADAITERLDDITKRFSEKLIDDSMDWKSGPRLMALMFDLDGFKPINDNYGHEAGDRVIVQVAEILRSECREQDIVIRWGGDEYMVVAEIESVKEAEFIAEKIRRAIANHGFDVGLSNRFHLSTSLGFALYPFCHFAPHSINWDQVHLLADQALYKSKDAGRNTWTGIIQADKELPFSTLNSLVPNLDNAISNNDVKIIQRERSEAT